MRGGRCPTCPGRCTCSRPGGRPLRPGGGRRAGGAGGAGGFSLLCGRYEGVDQRVADHLVDGELSVGDFVLAGGELAALVVVEAVARLLPGVLGNEASAVDESFADGLLEYPQYTRPAEFRGWEVPEVLRSGDHGAVAAWRRTQALLRTAERRPDLIERLVRASALSARRRAGPGRARLRCSVRPGQEPRRRRSDRRTPPMHPTETIDRDSLRDDIPEFRPGDTVKVHVRVVEGNRERVQVPALRKCRRREPCRPLSDTSR